MSLSAVIRPTVRAVLQQQQSLRTQMHALRSMTVLSKQSGEEYKKMVSDSLTAKLHI